MWSIFKFLKPDASRSTVDRTQPPDGSASCGLVELFAETKTAIETDRREKERKTEEEALGALRYVIAQLRKPGNRQAAVETESLKIDLPAELSDGATNMLDMTLGYLASKPGVITCRAAKGHVLFGGYQYREGSVRAEWLAASLKAELEAPLVQTFFLSLSRGIVSHRDSVAREYERLLQEKMAQCFSFIEAQLLQAGNRESLKKQDTVEVTFESAVEAAVCSRVETKLDQWLAGTGMAAYVTPAGVRIMRGFKYKPDYHELV